MEGALSQQCPWGVSGCYASTRRNQKVRSLIHINGASTVRGIYTPRLASISADVPLRRSVGLVRCESHA